MPAGAQGTQASPAEHRGPALRARALLTNLLPASGQGQPLWGQKEEARAKQPTLPSTNKTKPYNENLRGSLGESQPPGAGLRALGSSLCSIAHLLVLVLWASFLSRPRLPGPSDLIPLPQKP